jgi:predicted signal transduction protein with EAL and GGDEF domain
MRALGCTYGQGYHFARPMSGSEFVARLAAERSARPDAVDASPRPSRTVSRPSQS